MRLTGSYVWAGLDLLTFLRNLLHLSLTIELGFAGLSNLGIFNVITHNLLIISFLFSAYFTYKQKKLGFWIYVLQFPFRIYFFTFSFSALYDVLVRDVLPNFELLLITVIATLEVLRIGYFVKYFRHFTPKTKRQLDAKELLDGDSR